MPELTHFKIIEVKIEDGMGGRLLLRCDVHDTLGMCCILEQGIVRIHEMTGAEVYLLEDGVEMVRIGKGHPLGEGS